MPQVLITGGAKRIGKALVQKFADKGWDVAFTFLNSDVSANQIIESINNSIINIYAEKMDVRSYESIKEVFEKIFTNFGVPDVLINNAAMFPKQTAIENIDPEFYQNVLATNLHSYFYTSKIFSAYAHNNSRIINMASLGAYQIWKERLPYHISKAGVIQLTKALAKELSPQISVNSISPGMIMIADDNTNEGSNPPLSKIPMQRYGTVEDIFEAAYFFATTTAYITGQDLKVDGGYSL